MLNVHVTSRKLQRSNQEQLREQIANELRVTLREEVREEVRQELLQKLKKEKANMNKQHEILPAGITKRKDAIVSAKWLMGCRTGTRDTLDGAIKLSDLFKNGSWDEDDEIVASGYQELDSKEALTHVR